MQELRAFFAAHAAAGRIVHTPLALLEMLIIGPVAELTRRWLSDPSLIDLDLAQQLLPDRIVAAIEQRPQDAHKRPPVTKKPHAPRKPQAGLSAAKRNRT
jgi:hypothetical protein